MRSKPLALASTAWLCKVASKTAANAWCIGLSRFRGFAFQRWVLHSLIWDSYFLPLAMPLPRTQLQFHELRLALRPGWLAQVKCHACVGGTSVRDDTRILQAGVHVVVGTPGRVYDMLRRRALRADRSAISNALAYLLLLWLTPCSVLLQMCSTVAALGRAHLGQVIVSCCFVLFRIKMFVLDEADEMLSRGFKDQIYDIFQLMPPNLQVCI